VPLVGLVGRLADQKGADLVAAALPALLDMDAQFALLGSGQREYEEAFVWASRARPDRFAARIGFDEGLAHRIEAAADVFLMPSRFAPCGLNQMYSLRYGTPPIVRRTGGLADTVEAWDPNTRSGTGFLFDDYSSHALAGTIDWALRNWRDQRGWQQLVKNGMQRDFSWDKQGPEYVQMYRSLLG